jgi:hypothetical protein
MTTQVSAIAHGNHNDADYNNFLADIGMRVHINCMYGALPLFTTAVRGLWDAYLGSFTDPDARQYHNCHACRQFIERFGGLVTIDEDGATKPAIWDEDDAPEAYKPALVAMARLVHHTKVTGVFLASSPMWGTPKTGVWRHFAVRPTEGMIFKRATQTAGQAMAEKSEDFKALTRALGEITQIHLEMAIALLKTDELYRSEKVLGQAQWLHALHVARDAAHGGTRKANVVWRAVATAPAGFCHPRSSMIGTLLEDIAAGMRFEEVASRFAAKMHPLRYQRPQAAPTAGAIAAAEKTVEQLQAAGSLLRRFCRVDEVQALWRPAAKKMDAPAGGVFSHLKPKPAQPATTNIRIPAQVMTWEKFQRTVLPTAERIEFKAASPGPYVALVTAVHPDAPPILQWDREDVRNPVSWYFWNGGSTAASFGLRGGQFYDVEAITLKPSMWNGGFEHQGAGVMFVIAGARESRMAGAAIFPETLKAEFHGIRSVIEAYSRSASIQGLKEPHAAGVMLTKGNAWDATLRVWTNGSCLEYRLDRWD